MTEPQAGSDVKSLKTTAKRDGDEWVLNGTKVFITNGGIADVHVVVATVDPELGTRGQASFVVAKGTPGPEPGQEGDEARDPRLAHRRGRARGLPHPGREPARRRGEAGEQAAARAAKGKKSRGADALATFEVTRPLVGASALGIAQAAYEWTLEYLDGRSEGGVPLLQTQRIQQTLADVATEIEAARLLVQRAAWMGRNGVPMTGGQGSMSKLKAGDVTMWATTTLMDLVGPYAWSTECPLEKWFRDAKIYQLFEGTAEIQRMVISPDAGPRIRRAPRLRRRSRRRGDGEAAGEGAGPRLSSRPSASKLDDARPRRTATRRPRAGGAARATAGGGCGSRWRSTSALLAAEAVGGILTGSLAVLADAGHLLSDVGSIVLALIAARARRAAGRRAPHLRLPALGGAGGAGQRAAAGRGQRRRSRSPRSAASPTRPRSTAPACSPSALLGLAGNLAATLVLARGQREDINLEGVLRHSAADALGSLGVVVAGAFVLAGGSDDRRPDRRPADLRPRPRSPPGG